jgi:hypothetical protein
MPSPILPDGRLAPLPIPSTHDNTTLDDLDFADATLNHALHDLSSGRLSLQTRVHFDPDLGNRRAADLQGWRPALGQTGSAQSHRARHGIGIGDIFLFFGWFHLTECVTGHWRFVREALDLHVIFGWLEVGEVLPIVTHSKAAYHAYPSPRNAMDAQRELSLKPPPFRHVGIPVEVRIFV